MPKTPKILLGPEQIDFWDQNGYLVLPGALQPADISTVLSVVDQQWSSRPGNDHQIDITSGPDNGKTFTMQDAQWSHRDHVYKLNNLFLRIPEIRKVAYHPVIKAALIDLLEGEPLICNSLNFERGSQQPFHFDTWYMPPPVETRMVDANIALEPVDGNNGPLMFYPGSHKIPPWRFSNGGLHLVPNEAQAMYGYVSHEIRKRRLKVDVFRGSAGDVFLWHPYLYHGGAPIIDMDRTRKSLVVHYWRSGDLPAAKVRRDQAGAYLGHTLRGEIDPH